jgi:hypothetical protein
VSLVMAHECAVQFVDSSTTVPDISVGLADLNSMHNACSDPRSPTLSTGAADGAPYTDCSATMSVGDYQSQLSGLTKSLRNSKVVASM